MIYVCSLPVYESREIEKKAKLPFSVDLLQIPYLYLEAKVYTLLIADLNFQGNGDLMIDLLISSFNLPLKYSLMAF